MKNTILSLPPERRQLVITNIIATSAAFFLGFSFLVNGLDQCLTYPEVTEKLRAIPALAPLAPVLSGAFPVLQFAGVLLLAHPKTNLPGLLYSAILWALFTAMVLYVRITHPDPAMTFGHINYVIMGVMAISYAGIGIYFRIKSQQHRQRLDGQKTRRWGNFFIENFMISPAPLGYSFLVAFLPLQILVMLIP